MNWKLEAESYAKAQAPKESCGIYTLISGQEKFWPCKNIAEDQENFFALDPEDWACLLYTSPSPRDRQKSRMPSSA